MNGGLSKISSVHIIVLKGFILVVSTVYLEMKIVRYNIVLVGYESFSPKNETFSPRQDFIFVLKQNKIIIKKVFCTMIIVYVSKEILSAN